MYSKLTFNSNIHFVKRKTFNHKKNEVLKQPQTTYIQKNYTIDSARVCENGVTERINCCIAGGISNNSTKKLLFFHFIPSYTFNNLERTKNGLSFLYKKLAPSTKKYQEESRETLNALIIGAKNTYKHSKEVAQEIIQTIKGYNTSPTIFLGQKISESHIIYDGIEDSWYINVEDEYSKEINTIKDLKEAFDYVCISPKDKLYINGEELITATPLNEVFKASL